MKAPVSLGRRVVLAALAWAAAAGTITAGTPGPAPAKPEPPAASQLTAKERSSRKWFDEQRVDDCKIPPERRGAGRRQTTCAPSRPRRP